MKSFILIAVLAALTVCYDAATVLPPPQEETIRVEESDQPFTKYYDLEGVTVTGRADVERILFYQESVDLRPIPNTVQFRDVFYRGNSTTRINMISMSRMPFVPGHTHVVNNWSHVNVRFTTAPGEGLQTVVGFHGVYTDWA